MSPQSNKKQSEIPALPHHIPTMKPKDIDLYHKELMPFLQKKSH